MKRKRLNRKTIERGIYILLITGLVIYGILDSEEASSLIRSVYEAFTILFNT